MTKPILTGHVGTNAELFPVIFEMYVPKKSVVADVTYGKGVFWRNIDEGEYELRKSDLMDGIDFCRLPYNEL